MDIDSNGLESKKKLNFCEKCCQTFLTREALVEHKCSTRISEIKAIQFKDNEKIIKTEVEEVEENAGSNAISQVTQRKVGRPRIKTCSPGSKLNELQSSTITNQSRKRGRPRKIFTPAETLPELHQNSSIEKNTISPSVENELKCLESEDNSQPKKRGRKPKAKEFGPERGSSDQELVKCGKCDFQGTLKAFNDHNLRKHVGLGWLEGEQPVDLTDEKEVTRLVKLAFKVTKKGTCELCQDVKRSILGFVSHIQNCGKSEEEKSALKVQCPYCSTKCLKYSMPIHLKLSHPPPGSSPVEESKKETAGHSFGKRQSALKAATKFQEVLRDMEEPEANVNLYFFYEKGNEKLPKISSKLNNYWYKLKRENRKIPCLHASCEHMSDDVKIAKNHHFTCSKLPDKVFMCENGDFFSVNEADVKSHVTVHERVTKQRKNTDADANGDAMEKMGSEVESENSDDAEDDDETGAEEEAGDDEEECGSKNRKRKRQTKKKKKGSSDKRTKKAELDEDVTLRKNFCRRENLENYRGSTFFSNSLKITLSEEEAEMEGAYPWPEFHTQQSDWTPCLPSENSECLPNLLESIAVRTQNNHGDDKNWRKFKRFESDLINGVPTFFAGGSVRSLSWCKISYSRMIEKTARQYLAVATKSLDHPRNMHERGDPSKLSLLQIWDCGILENDIAKESPKFVLGIPHEGEIWDMSWFPLDTSTPASADKKLPRLGLLATASDDSFVRVWSICDPEKLIHPKGPPTYRTSPVAKLIIDEDMAESCYRLTVGKDGLIAGGYANGVIALWNLKNFSSPFCEKEGKCGLIRAHLTIQAHRTTITVLTFCPSNNRFLLSGALDRVEKLWDLESPFCPMEEYHRELCLNSVWPKNWPLIIYNFDEVVSSNSKGVVKFVRDIFYDRHQSCLTMDSLCLSFSFSDWLNALCGSSEKGDIEVKFLRSFICDQKKNKSQLMLSSLGLETLVKTDNTGDRSTSQATPSTYEEISLNYGLILEGNQTKTVGKTKNELHPEVFPIRAVNWVSFNPNFNSFTHLAAGYNCGFVRILCLKEFQSNCSVVSFLRNAQKK